MENIEVIEYYNIDDFLRKSQDRSNKKSRFFTVKLIKDRMSGIYERTVYFEIIGEIIDSEIGNTISAKLDPIFRHIDLYQFSEV
jgi:hypothetical protein